MSEALMSSIGEGRDGTKEIVFLCHNSLDKPAIRAIADALELDFGTQFFLDVFAIPTGEEFIPWIGKALEECAVCAIFLGGNGWGPTHLVEAEMALARYRRDPKLRIIPVALKGIDLSVAAKLGAGKLFQEVNWADFRQGVDDQTNLEKFGAALSGRQTLGYRGPARLTPYQMRRDAERWQKSRRTNTSVLYRGGQLLEAEKVMIENPDAVVPTEVSPFLTASRERQSSVWRRLALAAATAVVLLSVATAVAFVNYVMAEERRLDSLSRQLAIASRDAPGADRVLLIGARAVLVSETTEAAGALLEQLQAFRFLRRIVHLTNYVEALALGGDDSFIASTAGKLHSLFTGDATASGFDAASIDKDATVTAIVQGGADTWLGYDDGRVDVLINGKRSLLLPASKTVPMGRERKVRSLAYDASRGLLAVGTGAGRVAIVRLSEGRTVYDKEEGDGVLINSLSFDPKRPRLAIGSSEGTIELVDTEIMEIVNFFPRIDGGVLALGHTEDGSLAAVGREGRIFYFDRRNPELESPTTGDAVPFATAAAIDRATARIAVGDASGVVRLFDAVTSRSTGDEPLRGHSDTVTAIAFGKGKNDLVSSSSNGTVAFWDLSGNQGPSEELPQSNPPPNALRSDATGRLIGTVSDGTRAEVRRSTGKDWQTVLDLAAKTSEFGRDDDFFPKAKTDAEGFTEDVLPVGATALSTKADRVAWATSGGAILTMPTADVEAKPTVVEQPGGLAPLQIAMSGDGTTLASIHDGGQRIIVAKLGTAIKRSELTPPSLAKSIALSSDGNLLAVGMTDGRLTQYSALRGWPKPGEAWRVHDADVGGVTFSSEGRLLISYGAGGGGADRTLTISNAFGQPDPRRLRVRQAAGSVGSLSVGNGGGVAVGDQDGQVLRWSISEDRFAYAGSLTAGASYVSALLLDDEKRRLITASGDGHVRSWSLDPARWVSLACAKANRGWRHDDWRELLPDDPYVAECSAHSLPPYAVRLWRSLRAIFS